VLRIEILSVDIPFRRPFAHAVKRRDVSESIFVILQTDNGEQGFGESLPRPYVTGEDQKSVVATLKEIIPSLLFETTFKSFGEVVDFCASVRDIDGAARCAFELALLDGAGKVFGRSVADVLGGVRRQKLRYSAAVGTVSPAKAGIAAFAFRMYGIKDLKIKVGNDGDFERVKAARRFFGKNGDIRLDANGAWSAEEAIGKLDVLRRFDISAVEQPVPKDDIGALAVVCRTIPECVVADESLCTLEDAKRLVSAEACSMFNIRLSKCGGLIPSLKIAEFAARSGIVCQLGCQVGETSLLSAAGRHFAAAIDTLKFIEGSYAKFILAEDIVREDVGFGYGGIASPLKGTGLGVGIDEERLYKYTKEKVTLCRE